MSGPSVTIHDMQTFIEDMGSVPDIKISNNIGNVIDLGGSDDDLADDLGASLLSNGALNRGSNMHTVTSVDSSNDIKISNLEPLEPISFDIPTSNMESSLPEIRINRDYNDSVGFSNNNQSAFGNEQSASGPSINLSSAPRMSYEEEKKQKIDYLNKLNRIESKGYTLSKRFTMDNSFEEIKMEYDRLVDTKNLEASLKFQRQCMMGVVTGFEYLNGKFNPFDWQLDGWSESVHENIEDFDEVFEELYDKYKGRGNMPPEMKLMMSLVGSGFMFHMSNSFFRSKFANMDAGDIFKQNPQLAKQFAAAAAQQAGPGFGNFMGAAMNVPQTPVQRESTTGSFYQSPNMPVPGPAPVTSIPMVNMPQNVAANSSVNSQRREMRGPSGVDDILKTLQEVRQAEISSSPVSIPAPPSVFNQQPAIQAVSEMASIHSQQDDGYSHAESIRTGATGATGNRRGRRKAVLPTNNTMTLNL
jgi:hypothetical protein